MESRRSSQHRNVLAKTLTKLLKGREKLAAPHGFVFTSFMNLAANSDSLKQLSPDQIGIQIALESVACQYSWNGLRF